MFAMANNRLYLIIALLAAVIGGLAVYVWQEQSKPDGVEIRLDEDGLTIEGD
jgi:hypothetical protein